MGNQLFCPPSPTHHHHHHQSHHPQQIHHHSNEQTTQNYNFNLQMKYCFFKLLQHRDWTSVQSAIQCNPILAAQRDSLGCTTLHMTCSLHPTYEIISSIYQKFPSAIEMTDGQDRLPLHVAVLHGADVSILQALISFFPEAVKKGDGRGQLPLFHFLLWHTTPGNRHPNAHPSSLYEYHSSFPMEILQLLLPSSSSFMIQRDVYGYTPLNLCWESYRSVVHWNEEEYEERRKMEWKKLEIILCASFHGMPLPREVLRWNSPSETNLNYRRIHPNFPLPRVNFQWKMLHAAVGMGEYWCPRDLFSLLLEKFPEQVRERNEEGNYPLIMALEPKVSYNKTLQDFHAFRMSHGHLGLNPQGSTIHSNPNSYHSNSANANPNNEPLLPSSSSSLSSPIHIPTRPFSNEFIKPLLQQFPLAGQIPHSKTHQLPLHIALHQQRGWHEGVADLFHVYPEAVSVVDPISGLLPFAMPSLSCKEKGPLSSLPTTSKILETEMEEKEELCRIDTIYHLLQADPTVLQLSFLPSS